VAIVSTAFPRERRLRKGNEYSRVFGGADRSADRFFTVLARINELPEARLGLAISRRVAPRAVDRNRLRRLARESFRQLALAPLDYVVMARRNALDAPNQSVRDSLDRHFTRLSERAGKT
jgi:ribonuclease P protein component